MRTILYLTLALLAAVVISCSEKTTDNDNEPEATGQQILVRDYEYSENLFFDLRVTGLGTEEMISAKLDDLLPGDSITKLVLYLPHRYEGTAHRCSLYVNPLDRSAYRSEALHRLALPAQEYEALYGDGSVQYLYHRTEHYILIDQPVIDSIGDDYLGVYLEVYRSSVDSTIRIGDEVGVAGLDGDTNRVLKLIKHDNPTRNLITRDYVWRNVYSLGGQVIDPNSISLEIYKGPAQSPEDISAADSSHSTDGESYLHLLGLDENDDGILDRSDQIIDYSRGLIRFPSRRPFTDPVLGADTSSVIYDNNNKDDRETASRYFILVTRTEPWEE